MTDAELDLLLPADLPPGERALWHGRPAWFALARDAFRVEWVAAYFAALAAWNGASVGIESALKTLAMGAAAIALLGFLAYLSARATLYVVTTKRVVMRVGVALPIFYNLPFAEIESAALKLRSGGAGEVVMTMKPGRRLSYFVLWPHARPFRFARPQPALRSIPDAGRVAEIFARAAAAAVGGRAAAPAAEAPVVGAVAAA
jgi:hypothetical protein